MLCVSGNEVACVRSRRGVIGLEKMLKKLACLFRSEVVFGPSHIEQAGGWN